MSFDIAGKLIEKFDTQNVSDTFKKREFVIEKSENSGGQVFTDQIKFQLTQNRCDILDPHQVGDEIKISFNIRGRKWEKDGRVSYFTNLEAWRIEKVATDQPFDDVPLPSEPEMESFGEEEDDLPF